MASKIPVPVSSFIDLLPDAVCVVSPDGVFVFVSAAFERIFGYTPEEVIGKRMIDLVHPDDRAFTLQEASSIMAGTPAFNLENRYIRKDGQTVHVMWSAQWSPQDHVRIAIARDMTRPKQSEALQAALYAISEAAHLADDLHDLFERVHTIVGKLLPALNFSVAMHNVPSDRLTFPYHRDQYDQPAEEIASAADAFYREIVQSGQSLLLCSDMQTPATNAKWQTVGNQAALCWMVMPLKTPRGVIGALFLRSYSGGAHYTEQDQELLRFVSEQIATAAERMQLHAQLQYASQYDQLTDLPNRRLFHDRLDTALARARRTQEGFAVLFLDLDKFKQINDTLGHGAGDVLLRETAHRLRQCVRESDTVARIGGDEFVLLLEGLREPEQASHMIDKLRSAMQPPFLLAGQNVTVVASIGMALFPTHGESAQQLLHHADSAMYAVKKSQPLH